MIKTPLRYPGGKSRAAEYILSLFPNFKEYREPFLGGGSVFIRTKQLFPNRKYWLNDIYNELFQFWRFAQNDCETLINLINEWKNQYSIGKELHQFLNNNKLEFTDLEKAASFFIYNRITFSGTSEAGGFSEQAYQGRFTESSVDRIKQVGALLKNVKLTNQDYENSLLETGENVFLFLDPPYYSATKSALYGKNGILHKNFDHIRFCEILKESPHKWLITYDDSPYIRNLYSFANIKEWNLTYGMRNINGNSNQTGKELFISNYLEISQDLATPMLFEEIFA